MTLVKKISYTKYKFAFPMVSIEIIGHVSGGGRVVRRFRVSHVTGASN